MRVQNDSRFLFGTKVTSRAGRQLEMVAVVRATFRLAPGVSSELHHERGAPVPQGMLSAERHLPGDHEGLGELAYPGDFADYKPRADVLFVGSAYAPRGEPVAQLGVRFAVGAWSKTLRVVGDRRWEGQSRTARPTAPRPFQAMPIAWARAWGARPIRAIPRVAICGRSTCPTSSAPTSRSSTGGPSGAPRSSAP